ncbi:HTH-type transcriptional repressor FabR [Paraconexibacter sp. AEG42_29]|uniref:HTH-type transcriptional repressor FabR n=1 Tax=Paraconexibacter sp. AEG42_29 TaxID=2997339 RepID=A0AAU7AW73_9ACTN
MPTNLPPRTPRRRLPAAERRELIEQAAIALFAERGYHGTAIDEIARQAGITPPVLYDHFTSKAALHARLLERTRDELLAMWRQNLGGGGTLEEQLVRAFTAWAAYVQANPYAPRMFFRESTGVEDIKQAHGAIAADANGALAAIIGGLTGSGASADDGGVPATALAMTTEIIRGGLTELAIWWTDHPEIPAEAIVAIAMNTLWLGFERTIGGERWSPPTP